MTALVLAGALMALVRLSSRPAVTPAREREAAMNELTRRDSRLYFAAEAEPFTGVMAERYPSGELKARSRLVRGRLEGLSEGWYTNGGLQVREYFHEGASHGVRTKWFPDGQKLSEAPIDNGRISGTFRRWHENGALAEVIQMVDNLPDGVARSYYPSGALKAEATVKKGKVLQQHTWKDGETPTVVVAPVPN